MSDYYVPQWHQPPGFTGPPESPKFPPSPTHMLSSYHICMIWLRVFSEKLKIYQLAYHLFVTISSGRQRQTSFADVALLMLPSSSFLEAVTFSFTAKVRIWRCFLHQVVVILMIEYPRNSLGARECGGKHP